MRARALAQLTRPHALGVAGPPPLAQRQVAARAAAPGPPPPRPPPPAVAAARAARTAGLAASTALVAAGAGAAFATGTLTLPPWAGPAACGAGGVAACAVAALAWAAQQGRLVVEADAEGLHASWVPPYDAAAYPGGRPEGRPFIVVRPTGDARRGNGAFVRGGGPGGGGQQPTPAPVPAGAWLGAYEGDLLDEGAFWARYGRAGGTADYCMRIDRTWTVDGAGRAGDVSAFSPCHINHGRPGRANVARVTRRRERRVDLYAARDIAPGEELLLDYGRLYWQGREGEEVV